MMKILIVGLSVRAMVESAIHSGYPVIALDAFGDQDLKALTESYSLHGDFLKRYSPGALYSSSRQLAFDAVAYTSSLENHPDILSLFASGHPIIGNAPQVVQSVRRWVSLFAGLRRAGFSVPETIFDYETRKIDPDRRWLVKPVLSGGGHGIFLMHKNTKPGDRSMLQEYIPGKPCSASFVANGRECVLIGVTEQLIGVRQFGSQGFRYCGTLLPFAEALDRGQSGIILDQVQKLAAFLTREYGLIGVNGMDFILANGRVWLTEVNPRYSASMELIERAYELPVFRLHVESALNGKLPEFKLETALKNTWFFGKAILFAEKDVIAPDTRNWLDMGIRDVPAPGERMRKRNPICTILASRPTYEETFAELSSRAGLLKEAIYG